MDGYEFISSLIDSLVWPAAVLWIVYILRKPIGDILGKLANFKYGKWEATFFHNQMEDVKQTVKGSNLDPSSEEEDESETSDHDIEQPVVEHASDILLKEAIRLSADAPEHGILLAWQAIEAELTSTVHAYGFAPEGKHVFVGNSIKLLYQNNIIDSTTEDVLRKMFQVRNQLVHGSTETIKATITDDESIEVFFDITFKAVNMLKLKRAQLNQQT